MVGVSDHERGDVHEHDRVGVPVADVAAGAQLDLLFGGEPLPAVGADKKPCGALALGGPVGVVGKRRDPVQLGVDPVCGADHPDDGEHEHREQGEHDATKAALGFPDGRTWRRRLCLAHNRIRPPRRWRRILGR